MRTVVRILFCTALSHCMWSNALAVAPLPIDDFEIEQEGVVTSDTSYHTLEQPALFGGRRSIGGFISPGPSRDHSLTISITDGRLNAALTSPSIDAGYKGVFDVIWHHTNINQAPGVGLDASAYAGIEIEVAEMVAPSLLNLFVVSGPIGNRFGIYLDRLINAPGKHLMLFEDFKPVAGGIAFDKSNIAFVNFGGVLNQGGSVAIESFQFVTPEPSAIASGFWALVAICATANWRRPIRG
ncbi:MAG TPA: hypothetical protein VF175_07150 [Lacipirellula sp.]